MKALWTDRNLAIGRLDESAMRMQAHGTHMHSDSPLGIGTFVIPAAADGARIPNEYWQLYEAMEEAEALGFNFNTAAKLNQYPVMKEILAPYCSAGIYVWQYSGPPPKLLPVPLLPDQQCAHENVAVHVMIERT
jgi:hypothetical protein